MSHLFPSIILLSKSPRSIFCEHSCLCDRLFAVLWRTWFPLLYSSQHGN